MDQTCLRTFLGHAPENQREMRSPKNCPEALGLLEQIRKSILQSAEVLIHPQPDRKGGVKLRLGSRNHRHILEKLQFASELPWKSCKLRAI